MRQAAARFTPQWLVRIGGAVSAADQATARKLQATADRLTPRWWLALKAAADAADRAWQRRARALIARLTPAWWPRAMAALLAFVRHPWVRRAVWAVALLLAGIIFVRLMADIYKGDVYIYWNAIRTDRLYMIQNDVRLHGYLYSPAFIQILWPIAALPWPVFYGIWLGLMIVLILWMARSWVSVAIFGLCFRTAGILFLAALAPKVALESGNIWLLLALAAVAGFRWPWAYAFPLLTKFTPAVGLLWFLTRREWRNLAIALGATAAIVLVSFVIAPGLWFDWVNVLRYGTNLPAPAFAYPLPPLAVRLVIAAVMTLVAARYNLKWVVPIATFIAIPFIDNTTLMVLVGVVPLLRHDAWTEPRPRKALPAAKASATPRASAPATA